MTQENGADIALEIAGQKVNVKNVKSLNTGATLFCAGMLILLCYVTWTHGEDSKVSNTLFVGAVREQTTAMREATTVQRENNCLQSYQGPPQDKASFCRVVSR